MVSKEFITAGRATFTVEPPLAFCAQFGCKPHYTFRVAVKEGKPVFASLLTGPDNEGDYQYLGIVDPVTGAVRTTRASKFRDDSWPVKILARVLACLWAGSPEKIEAAGWDVHHQGKCGKCARTLTVPESVRSGIGPECARRMACVAA